MTGIDSTKAFRRTARANNPIIRKNERVVLLSVVLGIIGAIFAAISWWAIATLGQVEAAEDRWEQFLVSLIGMMGAVFFFASIVYSIWVLNRKWRKRRAAADLAIELGWHYQLAQDPRIFPATLFRVGGNAWVESSAHVHEPRYIEVGNYSYMDTENSTGRRDVGFVAIGLDRSLPHMYLESTHRGAARAYIPPFKKDQRLSLEGDFDRWFKLYCPCDYERDALYVITPDVMALMIDEAPGFDIEIIDDWMFIIARKPFDMADRRVLDFAQRVTATLGNTTARQSAHYEDHRSDDANFVEAAGSRLRTGRWLLTLGSAVLSGAVWFGIAWSQGLISF